MRCAAQCAAAPTGAASLGDPLREKGRAGHEESAPERTLIARVDVAPQRGPSVGCSCSFATVLSSRWCGCSGRERVGLAAAAERRNAAQLHAPGTKSVGLSTLSEGSAKVRERAINSVVRLVLVEDSGRARSHLLGSQRLSHSAVSKRAPHAIRHSRDRSMFSAMFIVHQGGFLSRCCEAHLLSSTVQKPDSKLCGGALGKMIAHRVTRPKRPPLALFRSAQPPCLERMPPSALLAASPMPAHVSLSILKTLIASKPVTKLRDNGRTRPTRNDGRTQKRHACASEGDDARTRAGTARPEGTRTVGGTGNLPTQALPRSGDAGMSQHRCKRANEHPGCLVRWRPSQDHCSLAPPVPSFLRFTTRENKLPSSQASTQPTPFTPARTRVRHKLLVSSHQPHPPPQSRLLGRPQHGLRVCAGGGLGVGRRRREDDGGGRRLGVALLE